MGKEEATPPTYIIIESVANTATPVQLFTNDSPDELKPVINEQTM